MLTLLFAASEEAKGGHGTKFGIPRTIWAMVPPQRKGPSLMEMLEKRKRQQTAVEKLFEMWEKDQEEELLTFGL